MAPKRTRRRSKKPSRKPSKPSKKGSGRAVGRQRAGYPKPSDAEAYKDGFSGRATYILVRFKDEFENRDPARRRGFFTAANVAAELMIGIDKGVQQGNKIAKRLVAKHYQIGCVAEFTYRNGVVAEITGFSKQRPFTRPVNAKQFKEAFAHCVAQSLASPLKIRIKLFFMVAWFGSPEPQAAYLFATVKRYKNTAKSGETRRRFERAHETLKHRYGFK